MENPDWHEMAEGAEFATQEDVSFLMQAVEENLKRYGFPNMPEGERVVSETPLTDGELPDGHILWKATIRGERIASLLHDLSEHWQIGSSVEINWQSEHQKFLLNEGFAEPQTVPDTASFLITKPEGNLFPEEAIIMQRDIIGGEAQYLIDRIMPEEHGNQTDIMPGDTSTEPAMLHSVTRQEVQELEAIVHALPLLLRPNS